MLKRPELSKLIEALASDHDAERESAVARLTLLGDLASRKVADLVRAPHASPSAKAAALRVLSATGGALAVDASAAALASTNTAVVEQACDFLGRLAREEGEHNARALDELTGLALSPTAPAECRLAAVAALEGLPDSLMRPVYEALAKDTSSRIVSRAARARAGRAWSLETLLERELTDDPALVSAAARDEAADMPVTELRRAIDIVRRREGDAADTSILAWMTIRGTLHEALAQRGSQLALYDLRESFESAQVALPIGFLTAAGLVGDVSCLEGIASSWEATNVGDRWYRDHLLDIFGAIVKRERLTREHPSLTRLLQKRPGTGPLVALAPKRTSGRMKS